MDKQNETILKILKQDSRFTAAQIAAASGMTEAEVQGRITAMENDGVISGYTVLTDIEKADEDAVVALIEVNVTPMMSAGFDSIARSICRNEEVKDLYLMSGSYDLALIVEGRNLREVARFVSEKLSVLKDVTSTSTHFILKKYKNEGVILDREKEKREELI